jgi:ABC-type dipeptide/oligopeptide/nickel transport system permease component
MQVMEDHAMRQVGWMLLVVVVLAASTGCLIPMYSGDPIRRAQELIYTSEDLRAITDEWERIWFLDQPSHMTPYRTHGGIL